MDRNDRPAQLTQTLYIEYYTSYVNAGRYRLSCHDMSGYEGHATLGSVEVTVDMPADLRDPIDAELDGLRARRAAEIAESNERIARIDDAIRSLQAIEYSPEVTS